MRGKLGCAQQKIAFILKLVKKCALAAVRTPTTSLILQYYKVPLNVNMILKSLHKVNVSC